MTTALRIGPALLLLAAFARTEEHTKFNFAIEWPAGEGWAAPVEATVVPAKLTRIAQNRALGRGLLVTIIPPVGATFQDDSYGRGVVAGASKNVPGVRITSERRHEFDGAPALTLELEADQDGEVVRITHLAVLADDRLYAVAAISAGGDHAWAQRAIDSFRFLRPPEIRSTAYRISYAIGQYVIGPLLLVGVVLGISRLVRRRSR